MKKFFLAIVCLFIMASFSSCGVGSYSVSSGRDDVAYISLEANEQYPVVVTVDGTTYDTFTVKKIAHKTRRDIKKTAKYLITTTPGTHDVKVTKDGKEVYSKKVVISTSETKIIEL